MITFPNAKINLGLDIVERRDDGYHNIETLFMPIPLHDALEIVPARAEARATLQCHGRKVDCPMEKNLVYRAWALMHDAHGVPPVEMHLYKHIPDGAGLGGGSSDATATLLMLNRMFDLALDDEALAALAVKLGADCPFFVYNRPMMATGIGDVLTPVDVSLAGMTLLLVAPAVYVSTREAYSGVTPARPAVPLAERIAAPLPCWQATVKNDFEPTVMAAHPLLAQIKATLLDCGACYAAMSGSGCSVFGLFDSDKVADNTARQLGSHATFVMKM